MVEWICTSCGHIVRAEEMPTVCEECGEKHTYERVEKLDWRESCDDEFSPEKGGKMDIKWRCTSCGYTYRGEAPLDTCPSCGGICTIVNATDYTPDRDFDSVQKY